MKYTKSPEFDEYLIDQISVKGHFTFIEGEPTRIRIWHAGDVIEIDNKAVFEIRNPKTELPERNSMFLRKTMERPYVHSIEESFDNEMQIYYVEIISSANIQFFFENKAEANEIYQNLRKWRFGI